MKYKVGDKVKLIGRDSFANAAVIGDVGKIIEITGDRLAYLVEFEKERDCYHDGNSRYHHKGKNHHCYWCSERMLELVAAKHNPIIIYQNGNEVVALDKETGKKGIAKCAPDDDFDFNVGAKIAFERLTGGREVDRAAKVGEYVKVLSEGGHDRKEGEILKVLELLTHDWVRVGKRDVLRRSQYVVVENYELSEKIDEPEKPQLYNGKVVCVNNNGDHYTIGKIYQFTDGVMINDRGHKIYGLPKGFKSFKDFQNFSSAKWLEVKE